MNYIVRETCSEIRTLSRFSLRDHWQTVAFAMAIYYLLTSTLPHMLDELIPSASIPFYDPILEEDDPIPMISNLYTLFLSGAFSVGLYSYMIHFVRRREIHAARLFDGFEHFFKSLGLLLVVLFFTVLWTLLLIVPGIIAVYRYSQAFIVLADHPEYGIMECIAESKRLMKGNKGKLFLLELSFIGWLILGAIPPAFSAVFSGAFAVAAEFVLCIPMFFVMAYQETANVVFYELVTRNLVAAPQVSQRTQGETADHPEANGPAVPIQTGESDMLSPMNGLPKWNVPGQAEDAEVPDTPEEKKTDEFDF